MRLISSIISQEKKENNRFFLRFPGLTGKNFPLRLFTNRARSAIIHPLKRACASGSMDRASDSGSEGWGFESLLAYQKSAAPWGGAFLVHLKGLEKGVKKTCRWHVFSPRESPSPISDASHQGCGWNRSHFGERYPSGYLAFLVHLKGLEKGVKKTCRWHVFSPRESPSPISDASHQGCGWNRSHSTGRFRRLAKDPLNGTGSVPYERSGGAVQLTGHGMKPPLRGTMCFNRPPQGSHF